MKPSRNGANGGGFLIHVTSKGTSSQNSVMLYGHSSADCEPKLSYVNANIAVLFQQIETCRHHILCYLYRYTVHSVVYLINTPTNAHMYVV